MTVTDIVSETGLAYSQVKKKRNGRPSELVTLMESFIFLIPNSGGGGDAKFAVTKASRGFTGL